MKLWKIKIYIIAKEFFHYSLLTYLIIILAETIKEGIVSYFFNINILLAVVILSGFIMTITYDQKLKLPAPSHKKKHYPAIIFSTVLSIGGGFLAYADAFNLGGTAIFIGCLAALIILLFSLLLLSNNE